MKRIIENNSGKPMNYFAICEYCNSTFLYQEEDIFIKFWLFPEMSRVYCPACKEHTWAVRCIAI